MLALLRRILACALCWLAFATAAANAQSFETAVAHFAADSFGDTEAAIGEVAASGHPMAAQIIQALQDGRLLFDAATRKVYLRDRAGKVLDATSGQAADAPASAKPVRVNNRIRRAIEAALGGLTLLAPEPSRRYEAAQAVFKSRDAAALATLDTAIGRETDPGVKRALTEARAAVVLSLPDSTEADKLAAIDTIKARGDQDAIALLGGLPPDTPPAVRKAAADAIAAIEAQLKLWEAAQNAWYGLSLGSVLLLAAIGLAITFGVMGVINMAHGEMVMLGAYTTFVVQEVIRTRNPALFDYSLAIAIPLAFLVAGGVGILVERGIIRFLYGRPLETLLATWGLSLILQQAVRTAF